MKMSKTKTFRKLDAERERLRVPLTGRLSSLEFWEGFKLLSVGLDSNARWRDISGSKCQGRRSADCCYLGNSGTTGARYRERPSFDRL